MGHKMETRKLPRHGTQESNEQKPSTIPSRKCNYCVWAWVVKLAAKYLSHIESVKTEKLKFELDKFLEYIPDEPKMPTICHRWKKQ